MRTEREWARGLGWVGVAVLVLLACGVAARGDEEPSEPDGVVLGLVVDPLGRPLPNTPVTVTPCVYSKEVCRTPAPEDGIPTPSRATGGVPRSVRTDAEGRFKANGLAVGSDCIVRVHPAGTHLGITTHLRVKALPEVRRLVVLPGRVVRGRIVDADRQGVPGWVTVTATMQRGSCCASGTGGGFLLAERLATNADGTFEVLCPTHDLAEASFTVQVRDRACWTATVYAASGEAFVQVPVGFHGECVAEGRVVDADGQPLADARIVVHVAGGGWHHGVERWQFRARTDAEGRWRLADLPPLRVRALSCHAAGHPEFQEQHVDVPLRPDRPARLDLALPAWSSIHGEVVDAEGQPVPNALVKRYTNFGAYLGQTPTDAEGRFSLNRLSHGIWLLQVLVGDAVLQVDGVVERWSVPRCTSVTLNATNPRAHRRLVVRRDGSSAPWVLRGTVQHEDGSPLGHAGVQVQVWGGRDGRGGSFQTLRARTDAAGVFVVEGLPPWCSCTVSIESSTHAIPEGLAQRRLEAEETARTFVLQRDARIQGRFVDRHGHAIAGATIQWQPAVRDGRTRVRERHAFTDESGFFDLQHVPSMPGVLVPQCGNLASVRLEVHPERGQTLTDVLLTWPHEGHVEGRMLDMDGQPLAGEHVALAIGQHRCLARTDARGGFRFRHLPPRTGKRARWQPVPVHPYRADSVRWDDEGRCLIRARHEVGDSVEVFVVDPDGVPVPRASAFVLGGGGRSQQVAIRFGIMSIRVRRPEGVPLTVDVRSPLDLLGRPLNLRDRRIEAEDLASLPRLIRLEPGQIVEGVVLDEAEQPVAEVPVAVRAAGDDPRVRGRHATTDASGCFRIIGVAPGGVQVQAMPDERWLPPKPVSAAAGNREVIVRLIATVHIAGRVVGVDGRGLGGLRVTAMVPTDQEAHRRHRKSETITDGEGRFRLLHLPPGVRVHVSAWRTEGAEPLHLGKVVEDVSSGTEDLEIRLELAAPVLGRIEGPDGEPIQGLIMNVEPYYLDDVDLPHASFRGRGDDPSFAFPLLAKGRYRLRIHCGPDHIAPEPVVVDAPDRNVKIVLARGHPVRGTYQGVGHGRQRVGVLFQPNGVRLELPTGHRGRSLSASRRYKFATRGTFVLPRPNDEHGTLLIRGEAGEFAILENVRPSDGPFALVLKPGVRVEGTIAGLPEKTHDAKIEIQLTRGPLVVRLQPDRDGKFECRALPAGSYEVEVRYERLRGTFEGPKRIEAGEGAIALRYVVRDD